MSRAAKTIFFAIAACAVVVTLILLCPRRTEGDSRAKVESGSRTSDTPEAAKHGRIGPIHTDDPSRPAARSSAIAGSALGSAQTDSKRFHDVQRCRTGRDAADMWRNVIRICKEDAPYGPPGDSCLQDIPQHEQQIRSIATQIQNCGDLSATLDEAYYDSMLQAARSGDTDAQLCFIEGRFGKMQHPLEYELWKNEALAYVDQAFVRGDWRIVELLGTRHVDNPPLSASLIPNQLDAYYETLYAMNRLLRLGASEKYARWLDNFAEPSTLNPDQIAEAEQWARQQYALYFSQAPELTAIPNGCAFRGFSSGAWAEGRPWDDQTR